MDRLRGIALGAEVLKTGAGVWRTTFGAMESVGIMISPRAWRSFAKPMRASGGGDQAETGADWGWKQSVRRRV